MTGGSGMSEITARGKAKIVVNEVLTGYDLPEWAVDEISNNVISALGLEVNFDIPDCRSSRMNLFTGETFMCELESGHEGEHTEGREIWGRTGNETKRQSRRRLVTPWEAFENE